MTVRDVVAGVYPAAAAAGHVPAPAELSRLHADLDGPIRAFFAGRPGPPRCRVLTSPRTLRPGTAHRRTIVPRRPPTVHPRRQRRRNGKSVGRPLAAARWVFVVGTGGKPG